MTELQFREIVREAMKEEYKWVPQPEELDWCSVKISDTDFAEFPSIKSVSCSFMLPF